MDARRLWRLPSSVKWVARAAPHLPASPKGSLYISRAFAILNVILLSSKLRTNKIGVDVEVITTMPSLEGRGTTIVVDECSRRSRRALCDSVTLKRT